MTRTVTSVALAMSVVSALTLTACGSGGGDQVASDAKQTLTVWGMGEEGKRLQEIAKTFSKKNPNITVKVTPVGWDVVHQKLMTAAAAGKLPDMAQMGSTMMGEFIELDSLEPVDTSAFKKSDFFPAAWDTNVKDGKAYGVPWYVDTRALYYRTDLAEKAGIDEAPATWKDWRKLAEGYQEKAKTDWGIGIQPGGMGAWQNWLPFLFSAGGDLLDENGKPALDSPESVKALKEYAGYFNDGLAKKKAPPGYDVVKDFGADRVPMFPSGPWMVKNINDQQPQLKGKWDVAPLPADRSSVSFIGGASLVTFKDSEHKAAAEKFTKFLTEARTQAHWYEIAKTLPANQAAWNEPALKKSEGLDAFKKTLDTAREVPPIAKWNEFAAVIDESLEKIARGADPARTAAQMQKATEGLVK